MSWILVAALVSGSPTTDGGLTISSRQAAQLIAADLPTGSLLFSQGDCLAVKVFTASRYTHVGAVVERDGRHYVYDSTGGAGVRTLPLADYLASQGNVTLSVYRPEQPLSVLQRESFAEHLDSQLGRPYAIRHHWTGARADGLHCAEYVTDALIAGDVWKADLPARVSPASLKQDVEGRGLYAHTVTLQLVPEATRPPAESGWCRRLWFATKTCSRDCYRKLNGWFCCK